MLKEMYEQFVGQGATCNYHTAGMYWYAYKDIRLLMNVDTKTPHTPEEIQELIHKDLVSIRELNFY